MAVSRADHADVEGIFTLRGGIAHLGFLFLVVAITAAFALLVQCFEGIWHIVLILVFCLLCLDYFDVC
jgi:hypothetical protein